MAYSNYSDDTQRDDTQRGARPRAQMFDVTDMNLKCAQCGADITELPFKPSLDRPVYCRDCNKNRRNNFRRNY